MLRRRVVAALVAAIAAVGCSGCSDDTPARTAPERETPNAAVVTGPLCDLLPSGDDPGAPASLTVEPADVALTWIPVLTTFEAAVRASGLAGYLRRADGVTILAPTDDDVEETARTAKWQKIYSAQSGRFPVDAVARKRVSQTREAFHLMQTSLVVSDVGSST
jgi:hypothetical protein